MEGQKQYASGRSLLLIGAGIMPKSVVYKVSKAAAGHFDASVAGIFCGNVAGECDEADASEFGYHPASDFDRLCQVVGWLRKNPDLDYSLRQSREGVTLVITEKNEKQHSQPKHASTKNSTSGFSMLSESDINYFLEAGLSREAIEAADESMRVYAADFCQSMINEGYAHLVTPGIVRDSAKYAKRFGITMDVASTYAVRIIESGKVKSPSPVFGDVHLSDIEAEESHEEADEKQKEVREMDLDEIIKEASSGTIRIH